MMLDELGRRQAVIRAFPGGLGRLFAIVSIP